MPLRDLAQLKKPYPAGVDHQRAFPSVLGLNLADVQTLRDELRSDLTTSTWGLKWMAPHPDEKRRILISDQLLLCVAGIEQNLIEAKLHHLELHEQYEQDAARRVGMVANMFSGKAITHPVAEAPAEDLPNYLIPLHIAGVLRAIGSALDCLGGVVVGMLALPTNILKADLRKAQGELEKSAGAEGGPELQQAFAAALDDIIAGAGPEHWLEWAIDYRNMLVHRGRRLELFLLTPREAIYGPDGELIPIVRPAHLLPRDPDCSDIEAFCMEAEPSPIERTVDPVLEEEGERTLHAVIESTAYTCNSAARKLLDVLEARRRDPTLLVQPEQQWPRIPFGHVRDFTGYEPGAVEYAPDAGSAHPALRVRLEAASLFPDSRRENWSTFTGPGPVAL